LPILLLFSSKLQVQAGKNQKSKATFKRRKAKGEHCEEQCEKNLGSPLGRRKAEVFEGAGKEDIYSKKGRWVVVGDHVEKDKLAKVV
jgi:hypothetical protein